MTCRFVLCNEFAARKFYIASISEKKNKAEYLYDGLKDRLKSAFGQHYEK